MINWKTVIFKTFLFYGICFLLLFFNILIYYLTFGAGDVASRIMEIWYIDFLFNYLSLILPSLYLIYVIFKSKTDKNLMKFNSNGIVLILLVILYFFREGFVNLFLN